MPAWLIPLLPQILTLILEIIRFIEKQISEGKKVPAKVKKEMALKYLDVLNVKPPAVPKEEFQLVAGNLIDQTVVTLNATGEFNHPVVNA